LKNPKSKIGRLVKSLKRLISVIPAQAGIQSFKAFRVPLDSRFHGNDDFLRIYQNWLYGAGDSGSRVGEGV